MSIAGFVMLTLGDLEATKPKAARLSRSHYSEVACPVCGARIGVSCNSPNGRKGRPHNPRIKLATETP